jgi:ubiquinone/menaquinone biosynthesis C-methylase UbiE/uncharacterized protein YbaR (Trm112 family)
MRNGTAQEVDTVGHVSRSGAGSSLSPLIRDRLRCPTCRSSALVPSEKGLRCDDCGCTYLIRAGVPLMVPRRTGEPMTRQKEEQAAFTDFAVDAEYETSRPHGTPVAHAELLMSKLRRGTRGLGSILDGGTALTVCGGSGMDAEFLARAGARVVCADISDGGASRARNRASRYGSDITSLVADAERLPFRDRSFDLVWVHDGLHHLENPRAALLEMARVAGRAVSVNEPARAAATAVAVRLGLAEVQEESGNQVARVRTDDITRTLESVGFRTLAAERYAMLYRHEAGPVYRLLSRPKLTRAGLAATRAVEELLGPFGNKLSVRAVRREP